MITPLIDRDNLYRYEGWLRYRKIITTKAIRIEGPFDVKAREGKLSCPDGYLAVDSGGYPYPIAKDEFERIYELVGTKRSTELLPFDGDCLKCTRSCADRVYCSGCADSDREHLHRSCLGCGYTWLETCADFAPEGAAE